ncbi:MAG: hypothetical protein E6K38_10165 [Gammaproteobacteria bacterium]|nr:MAG: hypothetical protein E6K38_10165 [Gammaproteobacteria bacterium]
MTVASAHMPVTAAHARSHPCCHQGVAEERIQAAITDLELQHAPAQAARDLDLRVGLACAAQGGHFAFVRLEQDVFRGLHSTAARVAPRRC